MRRLILISVLLTFARAAHADPAADVDKAISTLVGAKSPEDRIAAAKALADLGAPATDALIARLAGSWKSTPEQRKSVLIDIHADLPHSDGTFTQRDDGKPQKDKDWLSEIASLDSDQEVQDSLAIDAIIRALTATQEERAAQAIYDFAFTPEGTAFRDECGRYLRKMQPYSLSTLLRASMDDKRPAYSRYGAYQLDRLDKGRPAYVLAAAPNDVIEIQILHAIRDTKHPDAVQAVLDLCDANSSAVRKAAREAWMQYVTGPPPPPAPKKKRKLANGKMSDKEMPDYLTYREFAESELRTRLTALNNGTEPDKHFHAEKLTGILFDIWDKRRAAVWDTDMTDAASLAQGGKITDAAAKYDHILQTDPLYARRAEMAPVYLDLGKQFDDQKDYTHAAEAYDKALSVDPSGPRSVEATSALHLARAHMGGAGIDAQDELDRAQSADPKNPEVQRVVAEEHAAARPKKSWMLWGGVAAGAAALLLLLVGAIQQRRRTA
jgi:tetratricopeptide (TPR) repeat protein